MYLGISNSVDDPTCRVSVFAPIWIDNRTGFDLIFKDIDVPAAVKDLPFLGGGLACMGDHVFASRGGAT